jgi:hypothetical protein
MSFLVLLSDFLALSVVIDTVRCIALLHLVPQDLQA